MKKKRTEKRISYNDNVKNIPLLEKLTHAQEFHLISNSDFLPVLATLLLESMVHFLLGSFRKGCCGNGVIIIFDRYKTTQIDSYFRRSIDWSRLAPMKSCDVWSKWCGVAWCSGDVCACACGVSVCTCVRALHIINRASLKMYKLKNKSQFFNFNTCRLG